MKTIAERIKEGMEIRGFKQVDIIEKTGINKGALSSYLSGKYEPKQNNIYKLAKALNVNEAWLMGHDVPMERIDLKNVATDDSPFNNANLLSKSEQLLLSNFNKLNKIGQDEANKRIKELTYVDEYKKKSKIKELPKKEKDEVPEHLQTVAAHLDGELTDEIKDFIDKF